jgi:hypothetical protein
MGPAAWRPPHTCPAQPLTTCSQHPGTPLPCPLTSTTWPQQPSLALGPSMPLASCSSRRGLALDLQALGPLLGLSQWIWMLQCVQQARRCGSYLLWAASRC